MQRLAYSELSRVCATRGPSSFRERVCLVGMVCSALLAFTASCDNAEMSDDTATIPIVNDDDDDLDEGDNACPASDIAAYLTAEPSEELRGETLYAPNGRVGCSPLPKIGHIPCGWVVWSERLGDVDNPTNLGKCGFCDSDTDCHHPNSGFSPQARCTADEVAPGVRFCVEPGLNDWKPGDCSARDVEEYLFSDSDMSSLVACSSTIPARCEYRWGRYLPCGWSEKNCEIWSFAEADAAEIPPCSFCFYDAHCPGDGTCSREWGDGSRSCYPVYVH